jgi:leader peptidase (prepilin peptidase)/N-methyltransferase
MFLGVVTLLWLCAIDLKLRLLPDELNALLAILGVLFAYVGYPYAGAWYTPLLGGILGGGLLLTVRAIANRIYGFETMGLGDIKLLGAGGIWLGFEGVVLAIGVGALAGVLHGVSVWIYKGIKQSKFDNFRQMTIPAGPGFCVGLLVIAIYLYHDLPLFQ